MIHAPHITKRNVVPQPTALRTHVCAFRFLGNIRRRCFAVLVQPFLSSRWLGSSNAACVPGYPGQAAWAPWSTAAPAFKIAGEGALTVLAAESESLALTAGVGEVEDAEQDYDEGEEEEVVV